MKKIRGIFYILLVIILYSCNQDGSNQTITIDEDLTSLLRNPCMGWGLYDDACDEVQNAENYWRLQEDAAQKYASFFYIRWRWSEMEPEEGRYAWLYDENYKKLIKGAIDRGLKLSFCIYDNGQDNVHQGTPEYVRQAGAEGYTVKCGSQKHWTPYPDDPIFQAKLAKFVEAFAKEYDNPDLVDFVDGFNIGWWGEAQHIVLKDTTKLNEVFDLYTTLYSDHFKKIVISMPYNSEVRFETEKKIAYAGKGYSLRRNGLGSQWFTPEEQAYALEMFGKRLLLGEGCYWGGSTDFAHDPVFDLKTWRDVFDLTYQHAIDFHFNTLDLRETFESKLWMEQAPDLLQKFTVNGGYRFYPETVSLPEKLNMGKTAVIEHTWQNTGNGYLPNNVPNWNYKYKPAFALLNDNGEVVKMWIDNEAEPSLWLAGKTFPHKFTLNTEGIAAGTYCWAVAIVDKTKNNTPGIKLAIAEHTLVNGWFILAQVEVK
jgi:hypothetical protein